MRDGDLLMSNTSSSPSIFALSNPPPWSVWNTSTSVRGKSSVANAAMTRSAVRPVSAPWPAMLVFLQIGVHSMGTIFQQYRRLVSSRNCVVGSAAFFLVIWS